MRIRHLLSCTRAIFFENEDSEFPFSCGGTAFLLSFRGETYFATAKHVAKRFPVEAPRLFVAPDSQKFIPFNARAVLKAKNVEDNDYSDLAIFRVDKALNEQDFGDAPPVDLSAIRSDDVPPDGARLIFQGYPTDRTLVDYEKRVLRHVGVALMGKYGGTAESIGCHIVDITNPQNAPTSTLDGFSGSPVFWVSKTSPVMVGFCGIIIRATLASGKARYIQASILNEALTRGSVPTEG